MTHVVCFVIIILTIGNIQAANDAINTKVVHPVSISERLHNRREAFCKEFCIKSLLRMRSPICKRCSNPTLRAPLDNDLKLNELKRKSNQINKINSPLHPNLSAKERMELIKNKLNKLKSTNLRNPAKQNTGILQMKNENVETTTTTTNTDSNEIPVTPTAAISQLQIQKLLDDKKKDSQEKENHIPTHTPSAITSSEEDVLDNLPYFHEIEKEILKNYRAKRRKDSGDKLSNMSEDDIDELVNILNNTNLSTLINSSSEEDSVENLDILGSTKRKSSEDYNEKLTNDYFEPEDEKIRKIFEDSYKVYPTISSEDSLRLNSKILKLREALHNISTESDETEHIMEENSKSSSDENNMKDIDFKKLYINMLSDGEINNNTFNKDNEYYKQLLLELINSNKKKQESIQVYPKPTVAVKRSTAENQDEIDTINDELNANSNSSESIVTMKNPEDETVTLPRKSILSYIRNQNLRNRINYQKHPRLKTEYIDGRHKYILKASPEHPYYTQHKESVLGITHPSPEPESTNNTKNEQNVNIPAVNYFDQVTTMSSKIIIKEKSANDKDNSKTKNINEFGEGKEKLKNVHKDDSAMIENSQTQHVNQTNSKKTELQHEPLKDKSLIINKNVADVSLLNDKKSINTSTIQFADTFSSTTANQNKPILNKDSEHEIFSKNLNMNPQINNNNNKFMNQQILLSPNENINTVNNDPVLTKNKNDDLEKSKHILTNYEILQNALDTSKLNPNDDVQNMLSNNLNFAAENQINLPLILKRNNDGTFQLTIDKTKMCNCAKCTCNNNNENFYKNTLENSTPCSCMQEKQKTVFKRKINSDQLERNKNKVKLINLLRTLMKPDSTSTVQEQYYKNLINEKLLELFDSLNIPVKNIDELHLYIDNLPIEEKLVLENYVLYKIQDDSVEERMISLQKQPQPHSYEKHTRDTYDSTAESKTDRIHFNIQDKNDHTKNSEFHSNIVKLKTLIRNEIRKELLKSNVCSLCGIQNCPHLNDSADLENNKMLRKRHNNYIDEDVYNNSGDINSHGFIKKKNKIINTLLNWARDVFIPDNHDNSAHSKL